jgi:hypothetical protein
MRLTKIQRSILVALVESGGRLDGHQIKAKIGARFIGCTTWGLLRRRDCIASVPGPMWEVTDIGRTAAITGIRP